jgi:hypothetical protein
LISEGVIRNLVVNNRCAKIVNIVKCSGLQGKCLVIDESGGVLIFKSNAEKPTFKQLKSKNIRDEKIS